jgi:acetyl-CoA carboxylase carboxyltransferase component
MSALVATLEAAHAEARAGGGDKYVDRHRSRGKLVARDRIELLLDSDSHFLELMPLAGHGVRGVGTGAGVIGGIGVVAGVECLITASESTLKGGAINEYGLRKSLRLAEIGKANRLPSIHLTESAGADLPNQSKIFVPGGQSFRDITRASAAGVPSVCVVFGNATAGGAYIPGMSDYAIMVEDQAKVFLAGPPLVKMATGEVADDESLGGAAMHCARVRACRTTSRRTSATPFGWRARSSATSAGPRPAARTSSTSSRRSTTPMSCWASRRPISACPSTSARSSPASSTARASPSSRPSSGPR